MKVFLMVLFIFFSNSLWANHHFVCFKKISDLQFEKKASIILLPVKGDLSSGGMLSSAEKDKNFIDFKFSKNLSQKNKNKNIILIGPEDTDIKIDSKGIIREMIIYKKFKNILNFSLTYRCEMESSI